MIGLPELSQAYLLQTYSAFFFLWHNQSYASTAVPYLDSPPYPSLIKHEAWGRQLERELAKIQWTPSCFLHVSSYMKGSGLSLQQQRRSYSITSSFYEMQT